MCVPPSYWPQLAMQYSWSRASCVYEFFIYPVPPSLRPYRPATSSLRRDLSSCHCLRASWNSRSTGSICSGRGRNPSEEGRKSPLPSWLALLWIIRHGVCGRQNKEPRKERIRTTVRESSVLFFVSAWRRRGPIHFPSRCLLFFCEA